MNTSQLNRKRMKLLLNGFLIVCAFITSAQNPPVRFKNCKAVEMYFVSAEETPEWLLRNKKLTTYLNERLENYRDFQEADGKISIGIFIYENGQTCCASFSNMTNTELDPEVFQEIVNNMPDWKAARQRGKPVVFLKQLVLNVNEGKIIE